MSAPRCPRCPRCRLLHAPGDQARCDNAIRLGMQLSAAGAIPRACDANMHLRYKADAGTFLLQTENHRDWNDEVERLLIGECVKCGSTLSIYVGSAVAMKAMRGIGR